jgi:hypothetical protein
MLPLGYKGTVMSSVDTRYYKERALSERILAEKAADPDVAAFHEALAQKYTAFAETLDMGEASRWQGFVQNGCR